MNTPGSSPDDVQPHVEATPIARKPSTPLERMFAADALEDFLGIPRGGHRDPSPGEALPRWPTAPMMPMHAPTEPQPPTPGEVIINDDGTFTASPATEEEGGATA